MKKSAFLIAAGVTMVLALTGCMRLDTTTNVNAQGQIDSVQLVVGVQKAAFDAFGGEVKTTEDFKKQVESNSGSEPTAEDKALYDACKYTENDTEWVMTCDLNQDQYKKIMEQQSTEGATKDASNGLGTFTLDGSTITGTIPTTKTDPQAASMGLTSTAHIVFPGEVQSVSGAGATKDSSNANAVIIDNMKTDGTSVVITASNGSGSSLLPVFLIGGILFLLIIGAAIIFGGKRGSATAAMTKDDEESFPAPANDAAVSTPVEEAPAAPAAPEMPAAPEAPKAPDTLDEG